MNTETTKSSEAARRIASQIYEKCIDIGGSVDEAKAAALIDGEFRELCSALENLLPLVDHLTDEGPDGEGWQSDALVAALKRCRIALSNFGAKP